MTVANTTDLANMTLARIGANRITSDPETTTVQGLQWTLHYANTRDALLRSYNWNFARVELVLSDNWLTSTVYTTDQYVWQNSLLYKCAVAHTSGDFNTDLGAVIPKWALYSTRPSGSGFDFQYALPADYLRLVKEHRYSSHWEIERGFVLSDSVTVKIQYIMQVTDVTAFEPLFIEVLILRIAIKLLSALGLTMSGAGREQLLVELRDAETRARSVNSAENRLQGASAWNNARYGSGILRTGSEYTR